MHHKQVLFERHDLDENGNPSGGDTRATGIAIEWQNGALKDDTPNGAQVEDVLTAALGRLRFLDTASNGRFRCRENALAITKIEEAIHWLEARTAARKARGVEGTHNP